MSPNDIIQYQIRKKGYTFILDDIINPSRPINETIELLYKAMDLMVSYLIGDIHEYLRYLVEAMNMTKGYTDNEFNGLMDLITTAYNATQSIIDSGANHMFDYDERVKRISSALDLTDTMLHLIAKTREIKLNCGLEKYIMDGLGTLDGASRFQSDLLSGKFEKFKKGGE